MLTRGTRSAFARPRYPWESRTLTTQRQLRLAYGFTGNRFNYRTVARGKKRACDPGLLDRPRRSRHMPSGAARAARSSDATRPTLRRPCSIFPEIPEAREPAEPFGAGREAQFSDGRCIDIDQGNQRETWGGPKMWGQAWRDSIRSGNSALRPNARRIGRTTSHHNPTVNCGKAALRCCSTWRTASRVLRSGP